MSQGVEEDLRKVTVEVVQRGSGEIVVVVWRMHFSGEVGEVECWGEGVAILFSKLKRKLPQDA